MKILIVDDLKRRKQQLKEAIEKQHQVTDISLTNEFMTIVENETFDMIVLDMETWKKGKSVYNYFKIGKKLENIPIILYNAEEDTYFIPDRVRHEKDRILSKPVDVETVIDTVQQTI
ncbi:MAG: response regulator [Fibrobacter sp.]|nr:response regulator [Fibrobacter sp.]